MLSSCLGIAVLAQYLCGGLLDHRPFEEIRIHAGPQGYWVGEDEVTKIRVSNHSVFYQFVRFLQHFSHVRHVPMADVRTEDGSQSRAEGIHFAVEGGGIEGIVRLAAEV